MAKPTKKTLDEIAAENKIDISEENAQSVANNYIQPTIDAINQAEQKAIADTQAARKALENDYFKQYRNSMYNAQSRGLTGGLANMDTAQLRMQMGQVNADLSKDLLTAQANAETNRGTALTTAENYKRDYLGKMIDKVTALREQDYAQRYAEWQYAEQLAQAEKDRLEEQRRWQLEYNLSMDRYNTEKAQWEKNYALQKAQYDRQNKLEDIQYDAYVDEYLDNQLPDVARTYAAYMSSGNYQKAGEYLAKQANSLSKKYGADATQIINEVGNIERYNRETNNMANYENAIRALRTQSNVSKYGSGALAGISLAAAPFTAGLSLLGLIPAGIGTVNAVRTNNEYDKYRQLLTNSTNTASSLKSNLPTWYSSYIQ